MFWKKAAKKEEIVDYSSYLFDDFQTSVSEFYDRIEKELNVRKVPDLEMERVTWSEGGLASSKRVYLRMTREQFVFDVCAAPFGTSFFFSYRFAEIHRPIDPIMVLVMLLISFGITAILIRTFGFLSGILFGAIGLLVVIWILRNSVAMGLANLDSWLFKAPGIGPVYERFFRKETYYRQDTRLMYTKTVPAIVKQVIHEVTASNGVKLSERREAPEFRAPKLGL